MRSMMGDLAQETVSEGLPPMAVPMTVKMPEPMTAPMPRAVRETGPRVFLRECSGRSESEMSLSMDLVAKICRARAKSSSTGMRRIDCNWWLKSQGSGGFEVRFRECCLT